ncbi:unnamed protein product [Linum tenue]|uniref:Uncharacterized protein n=1 Tax=Linum tenue TaxID=586396 RepID=A0AAV0HSL7_9ROSI|nr:unnamed protein product [Linum tenue]
MDRSLHTLSPLAPPNSQWVLAMEWLSGKYLTKLVTVLLHNLLNLCGDDGLIRGWKWNEFTESEIPVSTQGNHMEPVVDLVNPQHRGPWGALSPTPENNAIALGTQDASIFSAAGDSCAYCLDVETTKIKKGFRGHLDYLHCIVSRNSSNQVITGSEDGTARIWDCKSGKCIRVFDQGKDKKLNRFSTSVRCIALDSSNSWLVAVVRAYQFGICTLLSVFRGLLLVHIRQQPSKANSIASTSCWIRTFPQFIRSKWEDSFTNTMHSAVRILWLFTFIRGYFSLRIHFPRSFLFLKAVSIWSGTLVPSTVTAIGGYGGLVDVISQVRSHYCTFCCSRA